MGRNKYIGKWIETEAKKIDVPFTCENLDMLLYQIIIKENSTFSHQDFVNWCEDFYWFLDSKDTNDMLKLDENGLLIGVLNDISVQWDLYLVNTYSLKELQKLDFSNVQLPLEWFENWLKMIRSI
jgi:hypothetical protein